MTKEEVVAFKNEAKNYKYYNKHILLLEDKVREVQYKMNGVSAVQYEEHTRTTNPQEKRDKLYFLMDKKQRLLDEISDYQKRVSNIDYVLERVKARSELDYFIINSVLIEGGSTYSVGRRVGFTNTAIYLRIESALKKIKTLLN